jgi:hypothetical protein
LLDSNKFIQFDRRLTFVSGNFDEVLDDDPAFVQLWHGLVAVTDVVANGGADLRPVIRSHGGGGARLDTFESKGFRRSWRCDNLPLVYGATKSPASLVQLDPFHL